MSRDAPPTPPEEDPDPPEPSGRIRLTGPGPVVCCGLLGLVIGWAVRPVCLRAGWVVPGVSWPAITAVYFAAAVVAGAAYLTWRTLHRDRRRLPAHQAVNRLVLGKASAVVGAAVAGGYLGYAIAHVGIDSPTVTAQMVRSGLAALGGVLVLLAGLALERACRVRGTDE